MDFINRETVCKKLNEIGGCGAAEPWSQGFDKAVDEAIHIVENTPAADVAPVKHGHWKIGYFHDRVCSCCTHPGNDLSDYPYSYCPNCGAKMDK